jgi:hypothetical protein
MDCNKGKTKPRSGRFMGSADQHCSISNQHRSSKHFNLSGRVPVFQNCLIYISDT